jgi:hypothetical protein
MPSRNKVILKFSEQSKGTFGARRSAKDSFEKDIPWAVLRHSGF